MDRLCTSDFKLYVFFLLLHISMFCVSPNDSIYSFPLSSPSPSPSPLPLSILSGSAGGEYPPPDPARAKVYLDTIMAGKGGMEGLTGNLGELLPNIPSLYMEYLLILGDCENALGNKHGDASMSAATATASTTSAMTTSVTLTSQLPQQSSGVFPSTAPSGASIGAGAEVEGAVGEWQQALAVGLLQDVRKPSPDTKASIARVYGRLATISEEESKSKEALALLLLGIAQCEAAGAEPYRRQSPPVSHDDSGGGEVSGDGESKEGKEGGGEASFGSEASCTKARELHMHHKSGCGWDDCPLKSDLDRFHAYLCGRVAGLEKRAKKLQRARVEARIVVRN